MTRTVSATVAALLVQASSAQTAAPNIVLIVTDDQGWTSTSVQLDPDNPDSRSDFYQTACLETLASQGMRFSNAYASAPVCSSTRASIQTGKSPAQLQMTDIINGGDLANPETRFLGNYVGEPLSPPLPRTDLPPSEVTIAERIKQFNPDYATAHFGKWHLSLSGTEFEPLLHGYEQSGWGPPVAGENPKAIDQLTSTVNAFLEEKAAAGQPFFLQISHAAPHDPIEARAATIEHYADLPGGERHDSSDAEFAAMIDDLDAGIGNTLDKLAELGLDDNTYVFVVSDNGGRTAPGHGNNLPLVDGKGSIHEGGLRVPMIVKGPGIAAGSHCGVPVITHDLFTTITALAGATGPLPEGVEGGDLSALLFNGGQLPQGTDAIERAHAPDGVLLFHFPHYLSGGSATTWGVRPSSAVRDGDFKLVKHYGFDGQPDELLLFNLAQNLQESVDPESPLNLADDMPEKVAAMNARLETWIEAVDASQAYEVSQDIELTWDAGSAATMLGWRSVQDVRYLFREKWYRDAMSFPSLVITQTPSGLSNQVYRFDGNDALLRKFFHVSEIAEPDLFDNDHSASFELWLRIDDLDQEQVLFESGHADAGLSITLGDGDGDGEHDEIRFRVLGDDGNELTMTATVPVSITHKFSQLVAVFSDDPDDRYVQLFFDGGSLGRLNGIGGDDEIDWDSLGSASLGHADGPETGASGGPGDLPFAGGGLVGEIALFRFNNHALDAIEVSNRFDQIIGPCPWDCADRDGEIGIEEFLAVLGQWGTDGPCDFDGGGVGVADVHQLLGLWGPCP